MSPDLTAALTALADFHRTSRCSGALEAFSQQIGAEPAATCANDLIAALWHHYGQRGWTIRITDHPQRDAMKKLLAASPGLARLATLAGATLVMRKLAKADHDEVAAFITAQLGVSARPDQPRPRRR